MVEELSKEKYQQYYNYWFHLILEHQTFMCFEAWLKREYNIDPENKYGYVKYKND